MSVRPPNYGAGTRSSPGMPPANGLKSRVSHAAPGRATSSSTRAQGPEMAAFVEHNKKDSKGNLITKRYQRGQLLGKGGFAKCYQVTDVDTKEELACKVIAKSSLTKQRHKQKLQSEIKIHKSQKHVHIANFLDVFEDKDCVYIIMELCSNNTMLELVKRKKRLTEAETRKFMIQIIEGVKHLHENNVIHRDLKLGNLFLTEDNTVKIGDFGLACKLLHSEERKKTLCGTPNYIAPEVLESKNGHSFEVDTWSIGVVMYTCLVGKPPFETQDVKSTYKLIKSNTYSFPSACYVSEKAKALIRKILVHRPEMRPSLGQILADAFFMGEGGAPPLPPADSKLKEALKDALNFSSAGSAAAPSLQKGTSEIEHRPPLHPMNMGTLSKQAAAAQRPAPVRTSSSASGSHQENMNPPSALERNISNAASCLSSANASPSSKGSNAQAATASNYLSSSNASSSNGGNAPVPPGVLSRRLNMVPSWSSSTSVAAAQQMQHQQRPSSGVASSRPSSGAYNSASRPTSASHQRRASAASSTRPSSALLRSDVPSPRTSSSSTTTTSSADAASLSGAVTAPSSAAGSERPKPSAAGGQHQEDLGALNRMHEWLCGAFDNPAAVRKAAVVCEKHLPPVWVSQWVDYSKKYGMGYTLNDGRYGVFFNDATKILLGLDNDTFNYMERKKAADGSKHDVQQLGKISKHGPELNKKVTLLDHFRNYLDDNKAEREPVAAPRGQPEFVYVRKWMRTKHSVIFRMSNNDLQVNFFDETEVMLWADRELVTYKAKKQPRVTHTIDEVVASPEMSKRVKYVRDILQQLVSTMS